MILSIFNIVLPVFLVIGAGYTAVRWRLMTNVTIDSLMRFTANFAIPCLLFAAISRLDLGAVFDGRLLVSFYSGAALSFILGTLGARYLFKHDPSDAVAIGFGALFSNSLLLGLPIMERAYGSDALAPNFAIISIHAPLCFLLGVTAMEYARADRPGRSLINTGRAVLAAMFRNALTIGLALGFVVNLSGLPAPEALMSAVDLIALAALPPALFGLGGVLTRYQFRLAVPEAVMIASLSLILHPLIAYSMTPWVFGLDAGFVRSATVTAAMAPGINAYIFASLYQRGQAQSAAAVLLGTALSVLSVSLWLMLLGT